MRKPESPLPHTRLKPRYPNGCILLARCLHSLTTHVLFMCTLFKHTAEQEGHYAG